MTCHPAHSGILIVLLGLTSLAFGSLSGRPSDSADKTLLQKARQILKEVPLIEEQTVPDSQFSMMQRFLTTGCF